MAFDTDSVKVSEGQKALAAYIKRETGKGIKAETIAVIDALREAYRKDPERVAERERQKAAARARKQEALDKALAKARKMAEELGVEIPDNLDFSGVTDQSATPEPEPEPDDDWADEPDEPTTTVVEKPAAKRTRKAAAKSPDLKVVEGGKRGTPQDPDTSAIEVKEAEDGWESDGDAGDDGDFFDDEAEDY